MVSVLHSEKMIKYFIKPAGSMEPQHISFMIPDRYFHSGSPKESQNTGPNFQAILDSNFPSAIPGDPIAQASSTPLSPPTHVLMKTSMMTVSKSDAAAAFKKQENQFSEAGRISDLKKYKDDQLLSNPGGDHYYLEQKKMVLNPVDQESFLGRIGKDISDAFSNIKNFFRNLFFGSKIRYRDQDNQIREVDQNGLVGSVIDFFKDMGSALSFGIWRPDGEKEPQGFGERLGFFFSKVKEAIFGDLLQGVSNSIIHMGEDLIFAGWNLLETIPDATIGNLPWGKKLTTSIFDNGQVVLDYLTDILPTGDAWERVHSSNLKEQKLPVFNNLHMPENHLEDVEWKCIRNTPFRKTIETIGSILMDIITLKILGKVKFFSEERHQRN